ncbi:MAG: hypothetical protein HZA53_19565 [Planctomycetes bacterium]|nr:hypothetical protein [Planctomycetota bacterium]
MKVDSTAHGLGEWRSTPCHVQLRGDNEGRWELVQDTHDPVDVLLEKPASLWRGGSGCGSFYPDRLSFAQLEHGRWAAAANVDCGGSIYVFRGETGAGGEVGGVSGVQWIKEVALTNVMVDRDGGRPAKLYMLFHPDVFAWGGSTYVVADGLGESRPVMGDKQSRIWLARMPEDYSLPGAEEARLGEVSGTAVIDGVDPRILISNGVALLFAREGQPPKGQMEMEPRGVQAWRSRDLVQWERDEKLSNGVLVHKGYSVYTQDGRLWLATPVLEQGKDQRHRIQVHEYVRETATWVRVGSSTSGALDVGKAGEPVWLIRSTRGTPDVVTLAPDGALVRRPL